MAELSTEEVVSDSLFLEKLELNYQSNDAQHWFNGSMVREAFHWSELQLQNRLTRFLAIISHFQGKHREHRFA